MYSGSPHLPASAAALKGARREARDARLLSMAIKAKPDFLTGFRRDAAYADGHEIH